MHWARKSALVSDTDQHQLQFTRDSSDASDTPEFSGAHELNNFFPKVYKSTGRMGQAGISLSLSHCVVAAAGMSAVYKSRRPMSSAARRRRDDVAWPISQHAMLPAARLLGKHGRQRRRRPLSRWSPLGSLRAPLFVKTPSSSRQTAIYDFFSHLPVLSGLCWPIFLRSDFCRERETMAPSMYVTNGSLLWN